MTVGVRAAHPKAHPIAVEQLVAYSLLAFAPAELFMAVTLAVGVEDAGHLPRVGSDAVHSQRTVPPLAP